MDTTNRRDILRAAVVVGGAALAVGAAPARAASRPVGQSPQVQPPLPYALDALAPAISARTVDFHYNKHHKGYFIQLAKLVAGTPLAPATLEEIILATAGKADSRAIFHAASQASKASDFLLALPQQAQAARLLLLDARATQVFVIQTQSAAVFCFGATRANRAGPIFAAGNAPRRANLAALWRFPCGF